MSQPTSPVSELEARQDEVLRQLDQLNERIEQLLREYSGSRPLTVSPEGDVPPPAEVQPPEPNSTKLPPPNRQAA